MKVNRMGVTRIVLIFKSFVIKIPNARVQWDHFLKGILANIQENTTWKYNSGNYERGKSYLLAPVLWCSWGGWILVMKRVKVCGWEDKIDYTKWIEADFGGDNKPQNYGYLNGIIVKIDYGQ